MGTVHCKRLHVQNLVRVGGLGRLRTTLGGNALEKILCYGLVFALEWFDEDDAVVWLGLFGVETLDADRHVCCFLIASRFCCVLNVNPRSDIVQWSVENTEYYEKWKSQNPVVRVWNNSDL